jgi:hypothetical protein
LWVPRAEPAPALAPRGPGLVVGPAVVLAVVVVVVEVVGVGTRDAPVGVVVAPAAVVLVPAGASGAAALVAAASAGHRCCTCPAPSGPGWSDGRRGAVVDHCGPVGASKSDARVPASASPSHPHPTLRGSGCPCALDGVGVCVHCVRALCACTVSVHCVRALCPCTVCVAPCSGHPLPFLLCVWLLVHCAQCHPRRQCSTLSPPCVCVAIFTCSYLDVVCSEAWRDVFSVDVATPLRFSVSVSYDGCVVPAPSRRDHPPASQRCCLLPLLLFAAAAVACCCVLLLLPAAACCCYSLVACCCSFVIAHLMGPGTVMCDTAWPRPVQW